jgi:hypothetical protein
MEISSLNGLILVSLFISTANGLWFDLNLKTIVHESLIPLNFFMLSTRGDVGRIAMALVDLMIPLLDFN